MREPLIYNIQCDVCGKIVVIALATRPGPPTMDLESELAKLGWKSASALDFCSENCHQIAVKNRLVETIGTGMIIEM